MSRRAASRGRIIPVLFFTFAAGVATGWWARAPVTDALMRASDIPLSNSSSADIPLEPRRAWTPAPHDAPTYSAADHTPAAAERDAITALARRNLRLPLDGGDVAAMKGQFGSRRDRGARGHEAVDILAPRNTPVHAVDEGMIAKLFFSRQGGITVYQFDPAGRFCYYYAHLEGYVDGLHEGQHVARGDIIGYVGTTGNAPATTPHLHFALFELTPERRWWQGTPIDPWEVFSR